MNRLDFKEFSGGLQARLLASFPSVGIQARAGQRRDDRPQHLPPLLGGRPRLGRWPATSSPVTHSVPWGAGSRSPRPGRGETVPVFNLDIDSHHTYFVGDHDYLVHDNTYPSTSTVVFDTPPGPELAKATRD